MGCLKLTYQSENLTLKVVSNNLKINSNSCSGQYRYGFQGQEKDNEVYNVEGGAVNYKYRMEDTRLGRFFAVDPLIHKYPHYSSYSFSGNRVIDAYELEGLEPIVLNSGEVIGYRIKARQGISQAVADFNEIYKGIHQITTEQVIQYNLEHNPEASRYFASVKDINNIDGEGWDKMNMNVGDELYFDEAWFGYDKLAYKSYKKHPDFYGGEKTESNNDNHLFNSISIGISAKQSIGNASISSFIGVYSNDEDLIGIVGEGAVSSSVIGNSGSSMSVDINFKQSKFTQGSNISQKISYPLTLSVGNMTLKYDLYSGDLTIGFGLKSSPFGFKSNIEEKTKITTTSREINLEGGQN